MIESGEILISQVPLVTKGLDIYRKLLQQEAKPLASTCGIWIYGPPGTGKSHKARWGLTFKPEEVHTKNINKWFDDYDSTIHKAILLDDFDKTHEALGHYLKIWADRYPF